MCVGWGEGGGEVLSFYSAFPPYITVCGRCIHTTKTYLCNFDPLKPHFYIVKLEFTGVYIIFIKLKNINCGYSLELPQ